MFCCLYITVEIYPKKVIIPLNSQFSTLNINKHLNTSTSHNLNTYHL